MKTYKRILAVILCVVMTLTAAPLSGVVGLELPSLFDFEAEAATVSSYSQGDIIEFGWYPQSKVTDTSTISVLISAGGEWISYGYYSGTGSNSDGKMTAGDYMRYKDVIYGSDKYRGVVFDTYRPYYTGDTTTSSDSYQDDNGYTTGNVYWFKYEPIEWRVLDPDKGIVMSETIIDAQAYNNYILISGNDEYGYGAYWGDSSKTYYANNYAESSIRQWLNKDFYNTAFSTAQQNIIEYTQLDNSAYSDSYSAYDSQTTNDKIYLLSWDDALNTYYDFSSLSSTNDTERRAQGSDYAKCQGLWAASDSYRGNSYWWLRTPGCYSSYACNVDDYGCVSSSYDLNYDLGIRPALNFNLSSGIFQSDVKDTGKASANGTGTIVPDSFTYTQSHTVNNYKTANSEYATKYFAGAAQPMDGSNGTPDLCIPGLSLGENMVPQGIAYYPAKNWLLVSSYYKDAETDSYPCYIYALDFTTGKMVAEYKLKEAESSTLHGHVGGIAVSNHNLYVTTDDSCIGYAPLSDLDKMNGEIIIREHTSMSEWLGNANTAYLSINDGMLITGNFFYAKDSKYDTPAKAANSVILAQNLSGNSSAEEWKNFCNSGPFAVVKVPDSVDRIQGVVYRDEKFFISSSLGRRNTSSLIIADIDKSNGYTLKNIYRFQAPPMMEGLTFADDYIYIVFESAAAFYREGLDGEGKSVNPTDVVWRISYNEWLGIDDTPTVTGDVENKYAQFNSGGVTGYTYLNFKQNWFSSDSMNYNHNLATLASQYVMIGYADEVSYSSKPDLEKALKAIGMSDIEIVAQAGRDEINYFIASRKITVNSQEYDLVFVGLIGSYHAQWYSNFDPGKGAIHKGFLSAKKFVYSALTDYIKDKGLSKDSTKILITGHSRGAAASNLLAADLIKGGVFAKPENIYTYCFATPNSTTLPERNEQRFKRIFNIVNPEDFVTKVLPTAWGYGRYGTTYVLPSKTNTTSSLYSAYRTNMQHYYGAFTQGDTYRPYIGGEADTRLVVESMISSIDNVNEFYDKTLWVGIIPMSAYDFFQNSLCHIVSKEASAADWADLAIIVEGTLTIPTSSPVFKNVLAYFLMNGTGLNPCFENAHKAETYCAYMMAMSETRIKQTRKGYLNTVNCPVDVEVIDNETGAVVGRIVNNVVDEEIAAKENALVMNVDGDSKSFWLPSDGDYEVKLIGNDEGTMDYTVAEIDPDLGEQERVNFFDVEITEGKEFTGDVPAYDFEIDEYTLKTDSGEEVPDQKLDAESGEITITTSVEGDGYITNTLTVKSGDYVTLNEQPIVTAEFVKWVESSGKTLSTDAEYSFVAKENTSIKAVFTTATGISIKIPSTTTVNCGDTLILHADFGEVALPDGYSIVWTVEGTGFNMTFAEDGLTCKMTSVANGNATVKATIVDKNGEAVLDADGNEMSDTQELKSNAGFWQKFVSFFKNLFRISRIILQSI